MRVLHPIPIRPLLPKYVIKANTRFEFTIIVKIDSFANSPLYVYVLNIYLKTGKNTLHCFKGKYISK